MKRWGALISLPLFISGSLCPQTTLEPDRTVEAQLGGEQKHTYRFGLQSDQYVKITIEQRSANVAIEIFGPNGEAILAADNAGFGDDEIAELIADMSGTYELRIKASDATAPAGVYTLVLSNPETATEMHRNRVAAFHASTKARAAGITGTRQGLLDAIRGFESTLPQWRAAGDVAEEAKTLYSIGVYYIALGDGQKALDYTTKALRAARASRDPRVESWALDSLGEAYDHFGDKRKAIEYFEESLSLARAASDRAGEANALNHQAGSYLRLGEKRLARDSLEQAVRLFHQVQDRYRESTAAHNLAATLEEMGDYPRALETYEKALALRRELKWAWGEAITMSNVGLIYLNLGESQKALDQLQAALELNRSLENRWGAAVNLNNMARVYASLGDTQHALQFFQQALDILRAVKDEWGLAHTLNYVGEIHGDRGDFNKALPFHTEALSFARAVGDADMEAAALNNIGNCYRRLGDYEKARQHFEQALAIHRRAGNQRLLAGTLRNLGSLHREAREYPRAAGYLNEAIEISRAIHDRNGEAAALSEIARLERDRDNLLEASRNAEDALRAFESLRTGIVSPRLRASLFASVRQVQELTIEILERLHTQQPGEDFDAAALLAAERGRARSLLDQLRESRVEIREGVDVALIARETELQQSIAARAEQQTRLLSGKHSDAESVAAAKELDALATDLEQVQSRIRQSSPQYAALTQPVPLNLKEIQTQVLDSNTVLMEYALGTEKSYLWAVTTSSVDSFELPPRAAIESAAKRVYDLLTARNQKPAKETPAERVARLSRADRDYLDAATNASRILLAPAASRIENKRLLIAGEGVLQYLPFGALPEPRADGTVSSNSPPLIVNHEIVTAASASVVAVLRQETAGRSPAPKVLAVFGDPVFGANDARVEASRTRNMTGQDRRVGVDPDAQQFLRLRFSRIEAEEISRMAPPGSTLKFLDFDASRDAALRPDLAQYRVVHFATHSLINSEQPELSGVVLSLVDRAGQRQNGFLRLYDIFNMRLGADLVVLSACRTALGGEVRGEGLIGLTRGFLYAGAPRVVASLWEIDDRTTAEVMKRFYDGMLVRGERPAAALRSAQIAMWKNRGWDAPYYWAAFALQGEWR